MFFKGKLHVINPATATFVMAIGIFLFSAVDAFSVQEIFSNTLTIAYLVCGIGIYALLILQIFRRGFLLPFLKNPVNSFVTGSWIAGIATLCDVALKYFPLFGTLVQIVILLTSILWGGFVILYLYQFRQLYKNYQTYTIHGVILLSTVATQSIVIAWLQVFPLVPKHVIVGMIGLGVSFYILGGILIGLRYGRAPWSLVDDWANTNCIIHGALSISGLALVFSASLSLSFLSGFWLFVFTLLLFIEGIEVVRAIKRISRYGWKKGVFIYDISQWSRNFTFGMFYALTVELHNELPEYSILYNFQEVFLPVWAWVVLGLLLLEIGLWLGTTFQEKKGIGETTM